MFTRPIPFLILLPVYEGSDKNLILAPLLADHPLPPPPETPGALSAAVAAPNPSPARMRTRAEKSPAPREKGKGRAGAFSTTTGATPTVAPAEAFSGTQAGPLSSHGVLDSPQSLSITDSNLKHNLPAIHADILLLGTTADQVLCTLTADRAEFKSALTSLVVTTDSISRRAPFQARPQSSSRPSTLVSSRLRRLLSKTRRS